MGNFCKKCRGNPGMGKGVISGGMGSFSSLSSFSKLTK